MISLNFHCECVNKLCRVCSERLEKSESMHNRPKLCTKYASGILSAFAADTFCDKQDVQTEYICCKCHSSLNDAHNRSADVTHYISIEEKDHYSAIDKWWKPWAETVSTSECWICNKFTLQRRGGCPLKKRNKHMLGDNSCVCVPTHFGFTSTVYGIIDRRHFFSSAKTLITADLLSTIYSV